MGCHTVSPHPPPPKPPQDFIRCVIGCLLFLITSLIVLIGHRDGAGIAAAVRGEDRGFGGRGGCLGVQRGCL